MIPDKIKDLIHESKMLLKNDEEYKHLNMEIHYVLENTNDIRKSIIFAVDDGDEMAEIDLEEQEVKYSPEWAYNIDTDIFEYLENEYNIGFISDTWHYNIWNMIDEYGIEEIEHKLGFQKYLKYCKENNIDKKYLIEKNNLPNVPDIMKYYEEKISYTKIENGKVEIPQDKYIKDNDVNYIAFCLGYDLLNDRLSQAENNECDLVYDFCNYLANKFVETDYYKNEWKSTYDNLREWLEDNKEIIQSEYLCYFKLDDKLILETGERRDTPVALVKRENEQVKEYIIAFNYEIANNKVQWGYGYYYDQNIEKAKADFEKVKAGESLADTFKDSENKSLEIPKGMEKYLDLKKEMETILKDEEEYHEYKIECMLIDRNDMKKSYGIAMCYNEVAIIDMEKKEVNYIPNAEYTFDIGEDSIFPSLQKAKMEIAYMSMEAHYGLWQEIDRYYPQDIKNKNGVQMYLKYCKENNITKEVIDRAINDDKTPDIMKLQDKILKNKNRERER